MNSSNQPKRRNPFAGGSHFFFGVGLVLLPLIYLVLMLKNTVNIAQSPAASWWVELWVLVGAGWLLLFKNGKHQNRLVVELSTFIAALLIFVTKFVLGTH
jgi:hypothetical protein